MSLSLKQIVKRRGALVATAAGLGVGAVMAAQHLFTILTVGLRVPGYYDGDSQLDLFAIEWTAIALVVLPVVLGIILSLWLLAPIAAELRLFHVIMRSVLAVGIGSTLAFIEFAVISVIRVLGGIAYSLPISIVLPQGANVPDVLGSSLGNALNGFSAMLPIGILAGVIAWIWLAAHPPRHAVSGMLDEV